MSSCWLLPPRARKIFEMFSDLVTIATCLVLAVFAWPVVSMLAELDQRSETANIPLVIPQAALPIGLLLTAFLIAVRLIDAARAAAIGRVMTSTTETDQEH